MGVIFVRFVDLGARISIRAYGDEARFLALNGSKLDCNQLVYFIGIVSNRWLSVRLELIGTFPNTSVVLC